MGQTFRTATKFAGLAQYPNSLSEVPPGSLQTADNVVIDRPSVVSPRRGQRVYATDLGNTGGGTAHTIPSRLFQIDDAIYAAVSTDGQPDSEVVLQRVAEGDTQPDQVGKSVTYPNGLPLLPPPGNAMRSAESRNVAFFTTADGIMKLIPSFEGSESGTMIPAGVPYGLDLQAELSSPSAGIGFLEGGYATAYRIVFGNTDPTGNVVLGAPSPLVQVENPAIEGAGPLTSATTAYGASATVFSVTLPFTAAASQTVVGKVVLGSEVRDASIIFTNASNSAIVALSGPAYYFGPAATSISIVFPFTITSVTTSTTLNLTGFSASFLPTGAGPYASIIVYSPYNESTPASTTGATLQSTLQSRASASQITVAAGTWTTGSAAVVFEATVLAAQVPTIFATTGQFEANDVVQLPGVTGTLTVITVAPSGFGDDAVTLDDFPTGYWLPLGDTATIYRPYNVTITATVPRALPASDDGSGNVPFYQVYRSFTQAPLVAGEITTATDNMQLAYQANFDTSAGIYTVTFVDIAPDATLGPDLYTSPRQQGILAAKYQPPVASDMCLYESTLLFGDCYTPATFSTQLLGASTALDPALAAIQPGDIITINGSDFTAVNGTPSGSDEFQVFSGSGSVTDDINNTVLSLSQAVNREFVSTDSFNRQVTLLSTAVPGTMGGSFTVQVSAGAGTLDFSFTPVNGHPSPFSDLPTGVIDPERQQNALYFSQAAEPEAVPLVNYLQIGQSNTQIQRVLPLPGACIMFKPEGIYQLTGTTADQFSPSLLNTTAQLLANESAVLLQSTIMAFTNQGVITVSQGGVQITSMAINQTLLDLINLPAFTSTTFAVGHEAERRYCLWVPSVDEDTLPTQAYTYNVLTNAWTRWPIERVCGIAGRADQLLYTGALTVAAQPTVAATPAVYRETPSGADYPYGDEAVTGEFIIGDVGSGVATYFFPTDAALGGSTLVASILANFPAGSTLIVDVPTGPDPGDPTYPFPILIESMANFVGVAVVITSDTDLTGLPEGSFVSATLYQGTECVFTPVPIAPDDSGTTKQFQEFELALVNTDCPYISATLATDFGYDETELSLAIIGAAVGTGYGTGSYGGFPWGTGAPAAPVFAQNARQLVTRGAARGHYWWPVVAATVACNAFHAQGLTLAWTPTRSLRSR